MAAIGLQIKCNSREFCVSCIAWSIFVVPEFSIAIRSKEVWFVVERTCQEPGFGIRSSA